MHDGDAMQPSPTDQTNIRAGQEDQANAANRIGVACFNCRSKKVKCSGNHPCTYCEKRSLDCVFQANRKRKLFSVSEVQELEDRVARYERGILGSSHEDGSSEDRSIEARLQSRRSDSFAMSRALGTPAHSSIGSQQQGSEGRQSGIATSHALSSTRTFGSEVRKLLVGPDSGETPAILPLDVSDMSSVCSPNGVAQPLLSLLPSEMDARAFFETVLFNIGQSQHFIDARVFSDNLDHIYDDPLRASDTMPLPFLEMLLVLALGKQLSRSRTAEESIPGEQLFKLAISRMPPFPELGKIGIPVVNVLSLAAVFFQNLDMTDDAYFYSSTALRLAVINRMHRKYTTVNMLRSKRLHLNRLWWTVYMQERRLAAATGNPMSLQDGDIDVETPFDGPGFAASGPIRLNIKLARTTGNILSELYVKESNTEAAVVKDVRRIIRSLYELTYEIPSELTITFTEVPLHVSRTSASLYLLLYQAMMFAIRPILLYLAKARVGRDTLPQLATGSSLHKLAGTCVEAARRSYLLLNALDRQKILGTFPFGDLDTLFSSTFVMVIARIIDLDPGNTAAKTIDAACGILKSMEAKGNKAAGQRRDDIIRMTDRLALLFSDNIDNVVDGSFTNEVDMAQTNDAGTTADDASSRTEAPEVPIDFQANAPADPSFAGNPADESSGQEGFLESLSWPGDVDPLTASNEILSMDELNTGAALYPMYNDQDMRLSGVDVLDWGEFQRFIEQAQYPI